MVKSFKCQILFCEISIFIYCLLGGPTPPPVDPCLPTGFQCPTTLTCISLNRVCDFHSDCPGGADEAASRCGAKIDFESGLGAWKNSFEDDYDFDLHQGHTASIGTGPSVDASGNQKGKFFSCSYFSL